MEHNGQRGAVLVVDVPEPSPIPSLAEPMFLSFNAGVEFRLGSREFSIEVRLIILKILF